MGYEFGRKRAKTFKEMDFKEKVKHVRGKATKAFLLSAIGVGAVAGPAYYHYGTVHEEEVKIREVKKEYVRYDSDKGESVYDYKIITDRGTILANENSLLHWKFNSDDIQDMMSRDRSNNSSYSYYETAAQRQAREAQQAEMKNKVYQIRYYGARLDLPLLHTFPNLLSIREITPDELAARADARAAEDQARQQARQEQMQQNGQQMTQPGQQAVQPVQPVVQQAPATGALSGTMITFETVVGGQKIEMTVPIEAANKITVNKVTPLVPQAPTTPRPGG